MTTKKTTNNHDYDEDWDRWFQELANPTNLVVVAADPVTGQLQEYRMSLPELEQLIEKETPRQQERTKRLKEIKGDRGRLT
jgi:hypothetical protein